MQHWYDTAIPELVPREIMPQIDAEDLPALLRFARRLGVTVNEVLLPPTELRIHQAVDPFKVERLTPELLTKPCLFSVEPYTLDGNHRVAGHRIAGSLVPGYQFRLTFAAAVKFMFKFPKTYSYADGKHNREQN